MMGNLVGQVEAGTGLRGSGKKGRAASAGYSTPLQCKQTLTRNAGFADNYGFRTPRKPCLPTFSDFQIPVFPI